MNAQNTIGVLNELLASEQSSLALRLLESTVFVSQLSVEDLSTVKRMARASEEHGAKLADLIIQLGGVPGLRVGDTRSADLHYQELHRALPRLVSDREALVKKYERAAEFVAADPRAARLVAELLGGHRTLLALAQDHPRKNT